MLKSMMGILFILAANISFAHNNLSGKNIFYLLDTVPVKFDAAGAKAIDSNILIVLNGKVLGTIREIKNLNNISPDSIRSINVLKDTAAFTRYGDKGKNGVVEIYTKNNTQSKAKELYIKEIKEDENIVFEKVDVDAAFPGGNPGWKRHLERNLYFLAPIENGAPTGIYTVVVQFIVDNEGSISEVKALTNFGYGMEEEVIRVIKKGPKWLPAVYKDKPVKAYRQQPVTFVVGEDGFEITMQKKYVLYSDSENDITIHVEKVKNKDLELRLSDGTITGGENGIYWIRVANPGKTILSIYNRKKSNKLIGSVYFIVKKKP